MTILLHDSTLLYGQISSSTFDATCRALLDAWLCLFVAGCLALIWRHQTGDASSSSCSRCGCYGHQESPGYTDGYGSCKSGRRADRWAFGLWQLQELAAVVEHPMKLFMVIAQHLLPTGNYRRGIGSCCAVKEVVSFTPMGLQAQPCCQNFIPLN